MRASVVDERDVKLQRIFLRYSGRTARSDVAILSHSS